MNAFFLIFSDQFGSTDAVLSWLDRRIEVSRWMKAPFPNSVIVLTEVALEEFTSLLDENFKTGGYIYFKIEDESYDARLPTLVWAEIHRATLEPDIWQKIFGPEGKLDERRSKK